VCTEVSTVLRAAVADFLLAGVWVPFDNRIRHVTRGSTIMRKALDWKRSRISVFQVEVVSKNIAVVYSSNNFLEHHPSSSFYLEHSFRDDSASVFRWKPMQIPLHAWCSEYARSVSYLVLVQMPGVGTSPTEYVRLSRILLEGGDRIHCPKCCFR
jgi:hypothetical protein